MSLPAGLVNGMSATRRVEPARVAEIVAGYVAAHPELRVIVVVEAYKIRVADHVPPGYQVIQHGDLGSPESAIAIIAAPGVDLVDEGLRTGTHGQNRPGWRQDIRDRPIVLFRADGVPMAGVHAPPGRMARLRAKYVAVVERVTRGRVVLGDWNLRRRALVRRFRRAVIASAGVLHIVARHPWRIDQTHTTPRRSMRGAPDHDAPQGVVTHR